MGREGGAGGGSVREVGRFADELVPADAATPSDTERWDCER